jgi:hypothetical protein
VSKEIQQRVAVLQHKSQQGKALGILSQICIEVCDVSPVPIDAEISYSIIERLHDQLLYLRKNSLIYKTRYIQIEQAIDAFISHLDGHDCDLVWEFYSGQGRSGFFTGNLSRAFCKACIERGHEGIAHICKNLDSGVLLDVVLDDPMHGDFYEIEWW